MEFPHKLSPCDEYSDYTADLSPVGFGLSSDFSRLKRWRSFFSAAHWRLFLKVDDINPLKAAKKEGKKRKKEKRAILTVLVASRRCGSYFGPRITEGFVSCSGGVAAAHAGLTGSVDRMSPWQRRQLGPRPENAERLCRTRRALCFDVMESQRGEARGVE